MYYVKLKVRVQDKESLEKTKHLVSALADCLSVGDQSNIEQFKDALYRKINHLGWGKLSVLNVLDSLMHAMDTVKWSEDVE